MIRTPDHALEALKNLSSLLSVNLDEQTHAAIEKLVSDLETWVSVWVPPSIGQPIPEIDVRIMASGEGVFTFRYLVRHPEEYRDNPQIVLPPPLMEVIHEATQPFEGLLVSKDVQKDIQRSVQYAVDRWVEAQHE